MRLLFRLRIGSAGLLKYKNRCKMITDARCVIYETDAGEDAENLLLICGKFERDRWVLADEASKILGWRNMDEGAKRERWLALGKRCGWSKYHCGGGGGLMSYVLDKEVVVERERFVVWRANGRIWVPSPPSSINSWTQHMHYYYHVFLTYLFVKKSDIH